MSPLQQSRLTFVPQSRADPVPPHRQGVDMMCLSAAVSHFLNGYLSSCQQAHPPLPADELNPKNSKRKSHLDQRRGPKRDA